MYSKNLIVNTTVEKVLFSFFMHESGTAVAIALYDKY